MSTLVPITDEAHFETHSNSIPQSALQVRFFHAPWAAPCAQMSTVLETLASTYPVSDPATISFVSIDAEELPEISEAHEVTAVPFVVLVKDGEILATIPGIDAAKVRDNVEKHHGSSSSSSKSKASKLPPPQQVTRPKEQPIPDMTNLSNSDAANPLTSKTDTTAKAQDLSAYAPGENAPATAPEYSSNTLSSAPAAEGKDLHARLTQLTTAAPVMLFMKGTPSAPQCGFSRQLVGILRSNSVRYGFFNILADEEVRQGLKEFADWPTFPQLWMGGELVGGLDILKEEMANDPDFFSEYSVDTTKRNQGGPAAPEDQAHPPQSSAIKA